MKTKKKSLFFLLYRKINENFLKISFKDKIEYLVLFRYNILKQNLNLIF